MKYVAPGVHSTPDSAKTTLMARENEWARKVLVLLKSGNTSAAIAQIKVAPSAKDTVALKATMAAAQLAGRWRDVDEAIENSIRSLSAPRLHRSP